MWAVELSRKADKAQRKLPIKIRESLILLISELEEDGPIARGWPNYSKLKGMDASYHCHIKIGRLTYVAC
jgi:mRNA-degrading endonuclease RelE of RelBE toxin-antitoxin system